MFVRGQETVAEVVEDTEALFEARYPVTQKGWRSLFVGSNVLCIYNIVRSILIADSVGPVRPASRRPCS